MMEKSKLPNCIYLTGFMGAGKSSVGKRLAPRLELPFYDLDRVIEAQQQQTINTIFQNHGENYFRDLELQALSELDKGVIALGGGAFMQKPVRDLLQTKGIVIFLDWPFEILYRRVRHSKHRPLVGDQSKLLELYNMRYRLYLKADLVWQSKSPHRESVKQVVKCIQKQVAEM